VRVKQRSRIIPTRNFLHSLRRKISLTTTYLKKMKKKRGWEAETTHPRELAESFLALQAAYFIRTN